MQSNFFLGTAHLLNTTQCDAIKQLAFILLIKNISMYTEIAHIAKCTCRTIQIRLSPNKWRGYKHT